MERSDAAVQRGRRQGARLWAGIAAFLVLISPLGPLLASALAGSGFGVCPFKSVTGLPCPTCGTTRAALALAEFQFVEALRLYPLPALGWMAFIAGGLVAGLWSFTDRPLPALPRRLSLLTRLSIVAAVLAYWIFAVQTGL